MPASSRWPWWVLRSWQLPVPLQAPVHPVNFDPFAAAAVSLTVAPATMLALQVLINIGMVTGTLPVTGINLPLISAGGSSVFFNLLSIGILLNISRHCHR